MGLPPAVLHPVGDIDHHRYWCLKRGPSRRCYIDRTDVAFEHLMHTGTQRACPYKGVSSDYWSVRIDGTV